MQLKALLGESFTCPTGADGLDIAGLSLDSRQVEPGFLFAALPGFQTDGRKFIPMAIEKGAVAVLAERGTSADVPVIEVDNPAEALAHLAARFYQDQPDTIVAVTGTNGKSSTVEFLRQIWEFAGLDSAALGTLGVTRKGGRTNEGRTTPDAVSLHQSLQCLAKDGVTHLAMEASSHGLKQRRMDGAKLSAAAFTNLSQDHLDYHPDFDDYYAAKRGLFDRLLPASKPMVVVVDNDWSKRLVEDLRPRGNPIFTVGWAGEDLTIEDITPHGASQTLSFSWQNKSYRIDLPLIGEFQAANALCASVLAIAVGLKADIAFHALENLKGVAGRLELIGKSKAGAPILIDYAHTPDGLDKLLRAVRPHTQGRVHVVFGAGGDRDPDKRAKMGAVASQLADEIIVTDDNPRSEDPALIRAGVMAGCPGAREIADRDEAIGEAIRVLGAKDLLVIAGKGHESGQVIGTEIIPFNEPQIIARHLQELGA